MHLENFQPQQQWQSKARWPGSVDNLEEILVGDIAKTEVRGLLKGLTGQRWFLIESSEFEQLVVSYLLYWHGSIYSASANLFQRKPAESRLKYLCISGLAVYCAKVQILNFLNQFRKEAG